MKTSGGDDVLKAARSALLDALEALREHRNSVIVIGAQAIYLHTGAQISGVSCASWVKCRGSR